MELKGILITLAIIFWHWLADFVYQTEWQATNKSKNFYALICHTAIYSFIWFPFTVGILFHDKSDIQSVFLGAIFVVITFILHTLTDYLTSKLNTKLVIKIRKEQIEAFKELNSKIPEESQENFLVAIGKGKWHNFFVSVGFDQVLHYTQIFLTYYFLDKFKF